MTQAKPASGGKRNWSSGGTAAGRKNKERGDDKAKGTRVAGWNKGDKKKEDSGRQVNAGSTRRRSEGVPRVGMKRAVSGLDRRKRKIDDDAWDDDGGGGGKNVSFSKSKFTRKTASTISHRKVSPGKGGRLNPQSLYEDDYPAGKRSTSKDSDVTGGVKSRLVNSVVFKGKKFDATKEVRRTKKGGAKEVDLDEEAADSKKSDDSGLITEEEKPRPRLTRVLDWTGKKIKPSKKVVVPDTEEPAPPKKRKRMKLDPYDTSNKRIEDSPIQDGTNSVLTF
jgi:hypothetical protein